MVCTAALTVSCAPRTSEVAATALATNDLPAIDSYARRDSKRTIQVFLPQTKDTVELWVSLRDELTDTYDVVPFVIQSSTTKDAMDVALRKVSPTCVILVNNPTVRLYQDLQLERGAKNLPPAVSVMASYLQEVVANSTNITGIAYEVPAVTSFVNVRNLISARFTRVGVVRRRAFAPYIEKQRELANQEKFQIVDAIVSDDPSAQEIANAVEVLRTKGSIEALWVLNDNVLLQQDLIVNGWLNAVNEHPLPVMVGVGALVHSDFHFGSFAILPDHSALGVQVADMIFELEDANWETSEVTIAQPLSVESMVDVQYARRHFGFREEKLASVDRVVE
jgi:hypothetical protein